MKLTVPALAALCVALVGCSAFDTSSYTIYQSSPGATPEVAYGQEDQMDKIPQGQRPPMFEEMPQTAAQQREQGEMGTIIGAPKQSTTTQSGQPASGDELDLYQLTRESRQQVNKALSSLEAGERASWFDRGTRFQLRVDTYPTSDAMGQTCRQAALLYKLRDAQEWENTMGIFCRQTPSSPWYFHQTMN